MRIHEKVFVAVLCFSGMVSAAGSGEEEFYLTDAGSEEEEAYFTDMAGECGLAGVPAQRTAFVDLDGDGFPDCVMSNLWKEKASFVFLNRPGEGGRVFENFTEGSGLTASLDGKGKRAPSVLVFADVDNDGDMDAFSGMNMEINKPDWEGNRDEVSAIYLNNGKGVFSPRRQSGVGEDPATTCAATFFDYDNDGWIDLFVGNWYHQYGASVAGFQDRLYRGVGKGKFMDMTEEAGLKTRDEPGGHDSSKPVFGAGHCDFNNDGLQDLLVCVYGRQWNMLWKNLGKGKFEEVGEATGFDGDEIRHGRYPDWFKERYTKKGEEPRPDEAPFRANGNSFSVACADYDGDGDMDLFLGEITHGWAGESSDRSALLTNLGAEEGYRFERNPDVVPRKHADPNLWNQGDMHVAFFDYDNDGYVDLLISSGDYPDGQYLRLYQQQADHTFEEKTEAAGFRWESSSGISLADYDRDGDLDILAGKSWMRMPKERCVGDHPAPALFRNNVGNRNHWINVRLVGKGKGKANRMGVGARITLMAGGRQQIREIRGGCGHSGQFDPPEAHFGIGQAEKIDWITVQWPDRKNSVQKFKNIEPDRFVQVVQGKDLEQIKPAR
jgi:hypothetical protein